MSLDIGPLNSKSFARPCTSFAPGHHVHPIQARLSAERDRDGKNLQRAELLMQEGNSFRIQLAGEEETWGWAHKESHVAYAFDCFARYGFAGYDRSQRLLKIWAGESMFLLSARIASPGEPYCWGGDLADVMRESGDCVLKFDHVVVDPGVGFRP